MGNPAPPAPPSPTTHAHKGKGKGKGKGKAPAASKAHPARAEHSPASAEPSTAHKGKKTRVELPESELENDQLFAPDVADEGETPQAGVSTGGKQDCLDDLPHVEIEEVSPPPKEGEDGTCCLQCYVFFLPYHMQIHRTAFFPLSPILSQGLCTFTI